MNKVLTQRLGAFASVIAIIGVVASPALVSAAATQSANTTVTATVNDYISVASTGTVGLTITPSSGGSVTSGLDTVTVVTNKATGYNLQLADADSTVTLGSGGSSFGTVAGATKSAPAVLTANTWGWAVASGLANGSGVTAFDASYSSLESSNAASTSKWAAMTANGSPVTIKSTSAVTSGDATPIYYAAKATTSLPSGGYSDQVTYTATTN